MEFWSVGVMWSEAKSRFCGRVMECWSDVEQSEIPLLRESDGVLE